MNAGSKRIGHSIPNSSNLFCTSACTRYMTLNQKQVSQAWVSNCIPQSTVGYNPLPKPEIPASGTKVPICVVIVILILFMFVFAYASMCFRLYVWMWSTWASCQIRKIAGAHAPGMPGTFSPSPQVSDPDMHHGTCVTHVPWCMPGSLTIGFLWNWRRGKTFPAFPAHAQPAILRIW